jgi:hypothetical protein
MLLVRQLPMLSSTHPTPLTIDLLGLFGTAPAPKNFWSWPPLGQKSLELELWAHQKVFV